MNESYGRLHAKPARKDRTDKAYGVAMYAAAIGMVVASSSAAILAVWALGSLVGVW